MKQITTFTNSFVLQEIGNHENVISELGFKKGGLSYRIQNGNVKFYLADDYFYKNLVWSADAPLKIDGILYDVDALPNALKKIFIQDKEDSGSTIEIDEALSTESHNPVANATITRKINSIDSDISNIAARLLNTYTKTETDNLLDAYLTIMDGKSMIANYAKVDNDTLSLNDKNITI